MSETPWYQEFFGEDYLRMYALTLWSERTAREVEGIVRLLGLPPGSSILDLCCGHGRHAIPLAQSGYRVTGQDLCQVSPCDGFTATCGRSRSRTSSTP